MADLRELTTDAKRLYEALDYLLEKQDSAGAEQLDLKEIWFGAKSRPFQSHILCQKEETICRRYLVILSALISLTEDTAKKTIQVRFLARILAACKETDWGIRELVTDGMLLEERILDEFQELQDEDLQNSLLIDLLLLTYLDGQPDEKQLDFAVGFMALSGIGQERARAMSAVVKGLLQQDDDEVIRQRKYLSLENIYCYMKNPPDGILVTDLEQAKMLAVPKVIFAGWIFQELPEMDCDQFQAEVIEFRGCHFIGINRFVNKEKKVLLTDCVFEKCSVTEEWMIVRNAIIHGCTFRNLSAFFDEEHPMIVLKDSKVEKSVFTDIQIRNVERGWESLCISLDTNIKECTFIKIEIDTDHWLSYIIWAYNGNVYNCKSQNCTTKYDILLSGKAVGYDNEKIETHDSWRTDSWSNSYGVSYNKRYFDAD
ncbi:MAG: hypothetical protein IJV50_03180 [Lachnospiraceae bacterium]|nr:hypothetical protein [Lachnospiraceae bacterium]